MFEPVSFFEAKKARPCILTVAGLAALLLAGCGREPNIAQPRGGWWFGDPKSCWSIVENPWKILLKTGSLVCGLQHEWIIFPFHIWDVIQTPLTNAIVFQDGHIAPPTSRPG
jgi:hypothetical protein